MNAHTKDTALTHDGHDGHDARTLPGVLVTPAWLAGHVDDDNLCILDVRGDICPYPMLKTVQALKELTSADAGLQVITDHAPALDTIPTQAARLGYAADIQETGNPEWRITLTRTVRH